MRIEVYSKPGCPLCDEALDALQELRGDLRFELQVRNILEDPALWAVHRYDVPVILVDGVIAFRHRVDVSQLRRLASSDG